MNKIDYITNLNFDLNMWFESTLLRAFIHCLSPEQSLSLWHKVFDTRPDIRYLIRKKICNDIEKKFELCHDKFIDDLISTFYDLSASRRQTVGALLSTLYSLIPMQSRAKIDDLFLKSKYISVRRRGYKNINRSLTKSYREKLKKIWHKFRDQECAWIITQYFPTKFIKDHRNLLIVDLSKPWQKTRIYLRIIPKYSHLAKELKSKDIISYCYVATKLGLRMSTAEALKILKTNINNRRLGLLIWCFGQQGFWSVLEYARKKIPEIEQAQRKLIFE